ncbi:dimethyl sulfoxide reductase anchor subunit family protein [Conservatibacter flavescens]|uniref:Dimethylsulfoxide reductase n=1 Tax=Conservatibacter flavescens TaxID=28161 RepID=A0A2M8RZU3_9PAST|nr:DmsC/YnfH family molybdoenzyme membrane anchor subunit [Conservatibacter flavescens]PJG84384.1 dimethylsulfoxide reductase [Conservatibacter flavescens]
MEAGLHELPLVIFTVLGQGVAGAFIALSFLLLTQKEVYIQRKAHYAMTVLWVLMAIAFIASTTHLGSPERAFNALNRVGQSGLSNEIATGSLFFATGVAYWLFGIARWLPETWQKNGIIRLLNKISGFLTALWQPILLIVVSLLGIGFVYTMSSLYAIPTVPTWNTVYTPIAFGLTALLVGFTLTICLCQYADIKKEQKGYLALLWLAFIIAIISNYRYYHYLQNVSSAVVNALDLVPELASISIIRLVLLLVGLLLTTLAYRKHTPFLALIGVCCVFIAECLMRILFYGSHMTVGMKALGL